ncbi:Aldehyde/histidinol dehydrogenase [Melampsora americana]|nr:Aldehyde/histidinol dehydrogenase [Melampsora americana]
MSSSEIVDQLESHFTSIEDIHKIHEELRTNTLKRTTHTLEWRLHQLKQLGYMLQENEALLEEALKKDLGKSKSESHIAELDGTRQEISFAINNLKSWIKPQNVKTSLIWLLASPKTYREPKGLVMIIGAWNYPVSLLINPLVGAIAGGNSVILKPSEQAPSVAFLLQKLIPQYMDPRHIRLINGAVDQTTTLLNLKFDHIFFTGSTKIGKIVAKCAAENLTPVTLELGGKCPVIVFDDADFDVTAKRLIWGKGMNAGQTCIAPNHILVSKKSEGKLIQSLKKAIQDLYPNQDESSEDKITKDSGLEDQFCKIINSNQFNRLNNLLLVTKGEIIEIEGSIHSKVDKPKPDEFRIPITLVRNLTHDDELLQDEIFGPILPILTYENETELIQELLPNVSQSEPLAIYVFTRSSQNFELVRRSSKSGQIVGNDLLIQFTIRGLPFGGVGQSVKFHPTFKPRFQNKGTGSYHGYHSFLTFTYERSCANLSTWTEPAFTIRYPPYTESKFNLYAWIMGPSMIQGQSVPDDVPN